jgi:gamma-glutamyltranspeptidase / glutathione hydrolase
MTATGPAPLRTSHWPSRILGLWSILLLTPSPVQALPPKVSPPSPGPELNLDQATHGMVTAAHPLASQVGLAVLRQGGNAVDAAVATTLAISVVEPFSAGLGGGGFLLLSQGGPGKTQVKALDFRERAPIGAKRNLYLDPQGQVIPKSSTVGYKAIAVPGTVAGLWEAHRLYGRLPWRQLVEPAIGLADRGFPVSAHFSRATQFKPEFLNPEADRIFRPGGVTLKPGDRLIQTDLANTLRAVSQGPEPFYRGEIAQRLVRDQAAHGGLITAADLAQYRPIWRAPVCGPFEQYQVCSMPPPSSGGVHLLQMLNLLRAKDLKTWGWHHPDGLHSLVEAMKIAYADRAVHLGDPDFVKVPVTVLISPAYADKRRPEVQLEKARSATEVQPASPQVLDAITQGKESSETSHLNVVDADRNAVSLTFTINLGFGSGVVAPGTGVVLNNEMDDFAIAPNRPNAFGLVGNDANSIAPRKTPLSSMTPTIVLEQGRPRLVLGAPGGSTIITTVLQIVLNVLVYDMDVKRAVAAPRLHHQWLPDRLSVDRFGFDPLTLAELRRRGHPVADRAAWGNANAIEVRPQGDLARAADPRGEGVAAGY